MQPNTFRLAQLGISALTFVLALAVIGCAGHSLHVYQSQSSSNPWFLPLWPGHFDSHGTSALIASGAITVVLCLFHLVLVLVPRFNLINHPTLTALVVLAAAVPSTLITLSTVAYAHSLNGHSPSLDTIETWTCKFKDSKQIAGSVSAVDAASNDEFGRLCAESRFAIWTTLVICILEGVLTILAVVGWFVTKKTQRREAREWKDANQVEMNGMSKHDTTVQVHPIGQ